MLLQDLIERDRANNLKFVEKGKEKNQAVKVDAQLSIQ